LKLLIENIKLTILFFSLLAPFCLPKAKKGKHF